MTNATRITPTNRGALLVGACALAVVIAAPSCGSGAASSDASTSTSAGSGGFSAQGAGGATVSDASYGVVGVGAGGGPIAQGPFDDFPSKPILDMPPQGAPPPANVGDLFGPADTGDAAGGPCLIEPEPGTLFPQNWARPRFVWTADPNQNLFELRIKAASNQNNELVVYTTATQWTMPHAMWVSLTSHIPDVPMTVSVRGATLMGTSLVGKPTLGTKGDVTIAPAEASGSIVYWRTVADADTGELKGFSAGDESVVLALQATNVTVAPGGTKVKCIGCHTSTPDGQYAAFKTLHATSGGALASIEKASVGMPPSFWSMASIDAMNTADFGVPTFSKAHWADGDHTLVTSMGNGDSAQLAWFDLETKSSGEGTAYGFLKRDTDMHGAIMPSFSHDGTNIVYMSTSQSTDGRAEGDADLYTVPYSSKMGGTATKLMGASDSAYLEYYPAYSPDDQFVAFNRVSAGMNPYNQPNAEVFVVPASGGTATRLAANDPIACSGAKSPGITNSWPKWAPEAVTVGDRTFYWIAFSSRRAGSNPQLYITAIVVQGGHVQTYPALYVWAQPSTEANHTPAWDVFKLPPQPPQ
jgi:hypothetical protein